MRLGSSPLARGTRGLCVLKYPLVRLIPARAGNTLFICSHTPSTAAHPRSRGEHHFTHYGCRRDRGSSPLARGTLLLVLADALLSRLIPARAGNTLGIAGLPASDAAHPRSRGEHPFLPLGVLAPGAAHPRSRGEHTGKLNASPVIFGSSPLARGTPVARSRSWFSCRLIPARAGNTTERITFEMCAAAHPRSRGEHWRKTAIHELANGSSPLARGTQQATRLREGWGRLIPARAGNTVSLDFLWLWLAAHPRSRGEHPFLESHEGL